MSSTEASSAYPALLTTTSSRPNASIAARTAAVACACTLTSWAIVRSRSPCPAQGFENVRATRGGQHAVAAPEHGLDDLSPETPGASEPPVLLALVLNLSGICASMTPEYAGLVKRLSLAGRRQVIVDAVAALLA